MLSPNFPSFAPALQFEHEIARIGVPQAGLEYRPGRAPRPLPFARVLPQGRIIGDRGPLPPAPAAAVRGDAVGHDGNPVVPGLQLDALSEADCKAWISR